MNRHRGQAGYTMVELMMALALLTVGILGIVSLQRVTVISNGHAKNLAIAQRIAQTWATQLQMDASAWRANGTPPGLLTTSAPDGVWKRPLYVTDRLGAAFDELGAPLDDDQAPNAAFCTHIRATWLYNNTGISGNGLIRAEIRVFWRRDGHGMDVDGIGNTALKSQEFCELPQNPAAAAVIGQDTSTFRFLYQTIGLRQHSQI